MTSKHASGIPRIIHQTWHSAHVPPDKGDPQSWQSLNPTWDYRFWNDAALHAFMAKEFPDLLEMYEGYSRPVQRADLARYCLLKHFGGIYADIDTRCLASLEPLAGDPRVVLCEEPGQQHMPALYRGLNTLYFNGTMAGPAGHPFWDAVIALCRLMYPRREYDVLETTGPLLLTAAVLQWPAPEQICLNSSHLFARLNVHGAQTEDCRHGPWGDLSLSEHMWQGSWRKITSERYLRRKISRWWKLCHDFSWRRKLSLSNARAGIDEALLMRPLAQTQQPPEVTILIPVRNAEPFLVRNFEQIQNLNYPKHRLHLLYGEGGSSDRSSHIIADIIARHGAEFASIGSVDLPRGGPQIPRKDRQKPRYQLKRRSGIAKARNDLLKAALQRASEWFLWLDADIIGLPTDLLHQLLAVRAKIVTPDCVRDENGPSYDLNAFVNVGVPTRAQYYRHVKKGLFQPPADYWVRRHMHDLRYLPQVPLDSVGGTALLVHADVHRAGLNFLEIPYRELLETEGFGQLARDLGVTPIGLPQIAVLHDNS